jgi:hypothetical protein
MYFVTTRGQNTTAVGELPLTASEALAFIEQSKVTSLTVEVRDERERLISLAQLRQASRDAPRFS